MKTDSRDAVRLARFLRSGDLTAIHVPDASTEAMRDLERAREDAKNAERVVRHQLSKFLLRQGHRYVGTTWTETHMAWIRVLPFEQEAHHRVLVDHVHGVEEASARVTRLDKDIAELVAQASSASTAGLTRSALAHGGCNRGGAGRYGTLCQAGAADELPGPCAVGAFERRKHQAWRHHADGQHACTTHSGRVCLGVSIQARPGSEAA
jgi:hypothetical protein